MRGRAAILVVLAVGLLAAAFGATRSTDRPRSRWEPDRRSVERPASESTPLDALDELIQERFRGVKGFGMARVPVVPQHVYRFDPETASEKAAVESLRDGGWTVGFYLGGRGLLDPPMSESEWAKEGPHSLRKAVGEPIVVSGEITPEGLPRPWELQEIGRRALEASSEGERYVAALRDWRVDVRPVRASRAECLECHAESGNGVIRRPGPGEDGARKVGDALGVAIYIYARTRR